MTLRSKTAMLAIVAVVGLGGCAKIFGIEAGELDESDASAGGGAGQGGVAGASGEAGASGAAGDGGQATGGAAGHGGSSGEGGASGQGGSSGEGGASGQGGSSGEGGASGMGGSAGTGGGACSPKPEVCNGLDDDCSGEADDGDPGGGAACTVQGQKGECAKGIERCVGGKIDCIQDFVATLEVCNGLDDNCDGDIDENLILGDCRVPDVHGACSWGTPVCSGGKLVCTQTVFPGPETDNGRDDNCNGQVDETNPKGAQPCQLGSCTAQTDFTGKCVSVDLPEPESCNGKDDDCSGQVDNGANCDTPHAISNCLAGGCVVSTCTAGWADLDSNGNNGCEYRCPVYPTPKAGELCNDKDDDCDGVIDNGLPNAGKPCVVPGVPPNSECAKGVTGCSGKCLQVVAASPEICDGKDNDCNGVKDDGFDLFNDVNNCGACNYPCYYSNSSALCQAGTCVPGDCAAGWANLDNNPGCEYQCPVYPVKPESCNGLDDDCNGAVDDGPNINADCAQQFSGASSVTQWQCSQGKCRVGACNPDFADCDQIPANGCEGRLLIDAQHCGQCGTACAPSNGQGACENGSCKIANCNAGRADCDGLYSTGCEVDSTTNAKYCGDCQTACDTNQDCVSGKCTCKTGLVQCSSGCSNLSSDAANCGTCNHACSSGPNASPTCISGGCTLVCNSGYDDCANGLMDGCETSILDDPSSCGMCEYKCQLAHAVQSCVSGACVVGGCNNPYQDCDGSAGNGCEVNLSNDPLHCGSCTNKCSALPNATSTCASGTCGFNCNQGYGNCDAIAINGCELSLLSDPKHCGACGYQCAFANASATCTAATCVLGACNPGWGNCDGTVSNGCETNTNTSTSHCGKCNNPCPGGNTCQAGVCK